MQIEFDHQLLVQLGLGHLPPNQQRMLLQRMYEVLELRVGIALAEQMTRSQMERLERYMAANDDQAREYIDHEFPGYAQVIRAELAVMTSRIEQRVAAARMTAKGRS